MANWSILRVYCGEQLADRLCHQVQFPLSTTFALTEQRISNSNQTLTYQGSNAEWHAAFHACRDRCRTSAIYEACVEPTW